MSGMSEGITNKCGCYRLGSDQSRFNYLNRLIAFFNEVQPLVEGAASIDYSCRIFDANSHEVYTNRYSGNVWAVEPEKGYIPFSAFIQDIVRISLMIGGSGTDSKKARKFNSNLLDYVISQYRNRHIDQPSVSVDRDKNKPFEVLCSDLEFAKLTYPADYIIRIQSEFRNAMAKVQYAPDFSLISENISLKLD